MVSSRGFSLIELLIVIAVATVLMGLTLATVPAIQAAMKRKRTETLLGVVRSALEVSAVGRGSMPSPAPHPLAGTADPRSLFVRAGVALNATGEGLVCARPELVDLSVRGRVIQPGDLFVGRAAAGDCPALFGLPRSRLGIIGLASQATWRHRHLPALGPLTDRDGNGMLDGPYDGSRYPDRIHLVSGGAVDDAATADAISHALGQVGQSEVMGVGGIQTFLSGTALCDDLLWAADAGTAQWSPGRLRVGGAWMRYRIRGSALYDAWGTEILYSLTSAGGIRLESAGRDGLFRWRPDAAGAYAMADLSGEPGDRDASLDNVHLVTGE